jgi:acetyl esterase/lipase
MDRRYAFGISSGGYNTSRMAVTFNAKRKWYQSCSGWCNQDTWKALAIIAASYATCTGPLCAVPSLPGNHPPTKFWHGTGDIIVPLFTADAYADALEDDGVPVEFVVHGGGHELNSTMLGGSGVKEWFDRYE